MKRVLPVFTLALLFLSCSKKEKNDLLWERSFEKGEAYFIKSSSDSGFQACGEAGGNPYFIRFSRNRNVVIELKPDYPGLFSSSWFDTTGYVTAGSKEGQMLLMRHGPEGNVLWEKNLEAGFRIDFTLMFYSGSGEFLAIGTPGPDSLTTGATGIYFIRFDTAGNIISEKTVNETGFISSAKAALDNSGNIYLAITRKTTISKTIASVAKYNDQFEKVWEKTLFNNPDFASSSLAVQTGEDGNLFISGKTELPVDGKYVSNSFLVSLSADGEFSDQWQSKRYLENYNEGSALIFDDSNNLLLLNRNCFILNMVNSYDGADAGILRSFGVCVSKDTDALGADIDIN